MDDERQCFPAESGAWPRARAFVERRCQALDIPRGAAVRLEIIAEELFINSAVHGGGGDRRIWLQVLDHDGEVELVIEDRSPEFDPFADIPAPGASANPLDRPVGGVGRALVAGLCTRSDYRRTDGVNRVTVAVAKAAGAARGRG